MKNKLLSLRKLLLLPLLALLISPNKANSYQTVGTTDTAIGAYNFSYNNIGTYSYSGNNIAGQFYSPSYIGVYTTSQNGYGLEAYSDSNAAVYGLSRTGYSAFFAGGFQGSGSCYFAGGAGFYCSSDRNLKENFTAVDVKAILQRVSQLPITRWNMKGEKMNVQHIGPTSQDFHTAFAIGWDDKHINTADIQGVALAAIQGLNQIVQAKDIKLQKQEVELQKQKAEIRQQEAKIAHLQNRMYAMNAQLTAKLTSLEQTLNASTVHQHHLVAAQSQPGIER